MKTAFKAALAAALSLLLIRWIHPPGPAALPVAALLFSVLQRTFIRAGGTGDLRAFQRLFFACLVLSVYAAVLILITPFLADYLVMNLFLFIWLFIFGFMTARTPGFSFWAIVTILSTSVLVGLNPQVPVATSTIINSVLGLITGLAIATIIGRVIWPLLPQRLLRDDLVEFLGQLNAISNRKLPMKKILTRLALLPIEALQALQSAKKIPLLGFARVVRMNAPASAAGDPEVDGRFRRPLGRRHAGRGHDEFHRQDALPRIQRTAACGRALLAHRREDAPLSVHD